MPAERSWDISVIGTAWELLKANPGLWMLGCLVPVILFAIYEGLIFAVTLPMAMALQRTSGGAPAHLVMPLDFTIKALIGGTLMGICIQVWQISMMNLALKQVDGQPVGADDLLTLRGRAPAAWVAGAVIGVLFGVLSAPGQFLQNSGPVFLMGIACLTMVVTVPLGALFAMSGPLIIDKGMEPMKAIGESWKATAPTLGMASLVFIVIGLASAVGMVACCVGIVFTMALAPLSIAATYRRYYPAESSPVGASMF